MSLSEFLAASPLPRQGTSFEFFLTAVKIVLCGKIVILLQHLSASKFYYPVGFSTLNYVIVLKTVLKY